MISARETRKIGGGVIFRDYRGTGLCPPNGGVIVPEVWVEHIPVIAQRPGVEDIMILGRVLRDQGLAIQAATDGDGTFALFTSLNRLCYGQRGINSRAGGTEHMHYATSDPWGELQCRAAAFGYVLIKRRRGIPFEAGRLVNGGPGIAVPTRRGHVSHKRVSAAAGYFDRSDPGPGYPWRHIVRLAGYFEERGTFRGAPTRD